MQVDGMKVSVFAIFVVMFGAVILQISVFLDPQNSPTGGVTSVGKTLMSTPPVALALCSFLLLAIFYGVFRVIKD